MTNIQKKNYIRKMKQFFKELGILVLIGLGCAVVYILLVSVGQWMLMANHYQ